MEGKLLFLLMVVVLVVMGKIEGKNIFKIVKNANIVSNLTLLHSI